MGASGSGKSTLMNIVGCLDRPTTGHYYLDGEDVSQLDRDARALVNEPAVLLADEPTGNLDTRTSIELMGVFQQLNDRGMTIVMVTHELDIAAYTRRNVVMRDGQIISDKPVAKRLQAQDEL